MHPAPITIYEGDDPNELGRITRILDRHEIRFYLSRATYIGHFENFLFFSSRNFRLQGFKIVISPKDERIVRNLFKELFLSRKLSMDISIYDRMEYALTNTLLFLANISVLSGFFYLMNMIIRLVESR